jgi:hypothetical protein
MEQWVVDPSSKSVAIQWFPPSESSCLVGSLAKETHVSALIVLFNCQAPEQRRMGCMLAFVRSFCRRVCYFVAGEE